MTEYLVPYANAESEFEEKRSRFISHVFLVESEAEARARIDEMKKKYYDARHNCWCFVLHDRGFKPDRARLAPLKNYLFLRRAQTQCDIC